MSNPNDPVDRATLAARLRAWLESGELTISVDLVHDAYDCIAAMKWQDIQTAPKDGTWILLWCGVARIVCGKWDNDWTTRGVFAWTDTEYSFTPSHWMPLPTQPTRRTEREG